MTQTTYKPERLTSEAAHILTSHKGYRDDTLFPKSPEHKGVKTDPYDVVLTEILGCGKYEICDFFIIQYEELLTRGDYRLLSSIVSVTRGKGAYTADSASFARLRGIIRRIIGDRDHCLWLCADPYDIYDLYLTDYIQRADSINPGYAASCPDYEHKLSLGRELYTSTCVSEILLPEDTLPLCDLGREGILACYTRYH